MIRQVINVRLKSCGKFWKREAAERMLMARSWWVTGRLENLWRFTLRQEANWWNPSQSEDSCAFDCAPSFRDCTLLFVTVLKQLILTNENITT